MGTPAVTYKIGGTYSDKGEKEAAAGIAGLAKAARNFNAVIAGFVGKKIMEGFHAVISDSTEAFTEQKDAQSLLFSSIQGNAKLTGSAFSSLKKQADSLTGIFDGSAVETQQAFAARLGLTQDQIESTTSAAVDLAASGVMPLEQATKLLSESYSGNAGELKKINPEVAKLTAEQLKHGDAVKLVAARYKGMASAMANTFSGRNSVFKNAFGDLQASVGSIWASLKFESEGKLLEPIKKITSFIEDHQTQIINSVLHLPEIFGTVFSSIWAMIKKTFSADGLKNFAVWYGNTLIGVIKLYFMSLWDFIKLYVNSVYQIIDFTIGNVFRLAKNAAANIGNFIIETLNTVIQKALSVPGIKKLYEMITGNKASSAGITFRFQQTDLKSFSDFVSGITNNFTTFGSDLKTNITAFLDRQKTVNANFTDDYSDINKELAKKLSAILNSDLPADLKKALAGTVMSSGAAAGSSAEGESVVSSLFSGISSSLGNFGSTAQSAYKVINGGLTKTAGLIGLIISLISSAISVMSSKSEYFSKSISFDTIFEKAFSSSKIDQVAKPLVEVLTSLGSALRPIFSLILDIMADVLNPISNTFSALLQALTPLLTQIGTIFSLLSKSSSLTIIINLFSKLFQAFVSLSPILNILTGILNLIANVLMWLYNHVVVPVYNGIVRVFTAVANFFVGIYNRIIEVLNSIDILGWHPFSLGQKDEINYDALKISEIDSSSDSSGDSDTSSSSSGSSSASYTAAKDVYVNIYFNNSYVNGDAQQIAIMLAKEIKSAERLGYVA